MQVSQRQTGDKEKNNAAVKLLEEDLEERRSME
jgi:hypothetical protein